MRIAGVQKALDLLEAEPSPLQEIDWPAATAAGVRLWVKRDELLDANISGNKWRKLLPQVAWALRKGARGFISVGGRHSNHLTALAALGQRLGIPVSGYVRAGVPAVLTPSLAFAKTRGMQLLDASRQEVRTWRTKRPTLQKLRNLHWLPEGGSNRLSLLGGTHCYKEIEAQLGQTPTAIVVAAGSGGTAAGLARKAKCPIYACDVVGDRSLFERTKSLLTTQASTENLVLQNASLEGFASGEPELYQTMLEFKARNGVQLDPLYTAKALLKLDNLLWRGEFSAGSNLVFVHTGGLQGLTAWKNRYGYNL